MPPHFPQDLYQQVLQNVAQIATQPMITDPAETPFIAYTYLCVDLNVKSTLANCALVCQLFYRLTRQIEWKCVSFRKANELRKTLNMLTNFPARPQAIGANPVAFYIRRMEFIIGAQQRQYRLVKQIIALTTEIEELLFWNKGRCVNENPTRRYLDGVIPHVAMNCSNLVSIQMLGALERPTLREIALLLERCKYLKLLQVDEIDCSSSPTLDYVLSRSRRQPVPKPGVPEGDKVPYISGTEPEHGQLVFRSESLETLVVGGGEVRKSPTERASVQHFVKKIAEKINELPALKTIECRIPLDENDARVVQNLKGQMNCAVIYISNANPPLPASYVPPKTKKLYIVVSGASDSVTILSRGRLPSLEIVHIFPMKGDWTTPTSIEEDEHYQTIAGAVDFILDEMTTTNKFPNVKTIVVWTQGRRGERPLIDVFLKRKCQLQAAGIEPKKATTVIAGYDALAG